MVLYFTGTGNSKFIADMAADLMGDSCEAIMPYTRQKEKQPVFHSERPYVIVAPIYAWRYPKIVEDFLRRAEFNGSADIYFLATMECQSGNAAKYLKKIVERKNMNFRGFAGFDMPCNFITSYTMPSPEQTNAMLQRIIPEAEAVIEEIRNGNDIHKTDITPMAGFMSGVVNTGFYSFFTGTGGFYVSDDCISCERCERSCPLGNIRIENKKPVFGKNCTACYSCIQRCPKDAINVRGKTEGKQRYVCPEYRKWAGTNREKEKVDGEQYTTD